MIRVGSVCFLLPFPSTADQEKSDDDERYEYWDGLNSLGNNLCVSLGATIVKQTVNLCVCAPLNPHTQLRLNDNGSDYNGRTIDTTQNCMKGRRTAVQIMVLRLL